MEERTNRGGEMKIASLVWFKVFPARFGGQKGIALFQEHLSKHFSITCICSSDNFAEGQMPLEVLPVLPRSKSQFLNPFCWAKICKLLRRYGARIILLEHPYYAIAAVLAKKMYGLPIVLHQHNIEYRRFRELKRWWWPLLKKLEAWACRQSSLVFFKTEDDRRIAVAKFGLKEERTMVLPYGIERKPPHTGSRERIREKHGLKEDEKMLLFAGTLDYEPNAEAVVSIYKHLAPLLEERKMKVKVVVCGRNRFPQFAYLNELNHPLVVMAGEVDEIDPYFAAADVLVNPVRSGGGIQTKVLDALSRHVSAVCFENLLSGIREDLCGGKLFSAADGDWKDFAGKVQEAISQPHRPTPEAFFDYYSWERLADEAARKIRELGD
jgi:glycosyltransferase involved in cell wall biosynthesis